MKKVFERSDFPPAPGGNLYHWKLATTIFSVPESDQYVIAIRARAENAQQKDACTDDDALRVAIDGFEFATKEVHDEKISWKGFGTSAAWNGASLKGSSKTNCFFVELGAGEHVIDFYADETPVLEKIEVFQLTDMIFEDFDLKPDPSISTRRKGIPWRSFIFQGARPNFSFWKQFVRVQHSDQRVEMTIILR